VNEGGVRLHQAATTDARDHRDIGGLMVAQPDLATERIWTAVRGSTTARKRIEQRQGCAAVLFKPTSHTAVWAEGEWFPS